MKRVDIVRELASRAHAAAGVHVWKDPTLQRALRLVWPGMTIVALLEAVPLRRGLPDEILRRGLSDEIMCGATNGGT